MGRTDTASHVLEAEPERVYAALVDADALLTWLPPVGMTARFDRFDGRQGGGSRMVLTYADASTAPGKATADSDVVEARFVDMVPGVKVVQAVDFVSDDPRYSGTMTMTWELSRAEAGTESRFAPKTFLRASRPTITRRGSGPRSRISRHTWSGDARPRTASRGGYAPDGALADSAVRSLVGRLPRDSRQDLTRARGRDRRHHRRARWSDAGLSHDQAGRPRSVLRGGRPDTRTGRRQAGVPSGGCSSSRGLYSTSWMRPSKVRCSIISRATSG